MWFRYKVKKYKNGNDLAGPNCGRTRWTDLIWWVFQSSFWSRILNLEAELPCSEQDEIAPHKEAKIWIESEKHNQIKATQLGANQCSEKFSDQIECAD